MSVAPTRGTAWWIPSVHRGSRPPAARKIMIAPPLALSARQDGQRPAGPLRVPCRSLRSRRGRSPRAVRSHVAGDPTRVMDLSVDVATERPPVVAARRRSQSHRLRPGALSRPEPDRGATGCVAPRRDAFGRSGCLLVRTRSARPKPRKARGRAGRAQRRPGSRDTVHRRPLRRPREPRGPGLAHLRGGRRAPCSLHGTHREVAIPTSRHRGLEVVGHRSSV